MNEWMNEYDDFIITVCLHNNFNKSLCECLKELQLQLHCKRPVMILYGEMILF